MSTFAEQAREALTEKLKQGKKAGHCDLHGLIESDLDQNYRAALETLWSIILGSDHPDYRRDDQAEKYMESLINNYLDKYPDLVLDEAAELRRDYEELQREDS
jgi:hypothetical protein